MKVIPLFIASLFLLSVPAAAENAQEKIFNQYITQNDFFANQLKLKALRTFSITHPACEDKSPGYIRLKPNVIIPYQFTVETTDKFDNELEDYDLSINAIHPSFGQWVERARVSACGLQTVINTLIVAYETQSVPVMYPLINGETNIEIKYQSMAENIVYNEVKQKTDCTDEGIIQDTNLIGYRSAESGQLTSDNENAGWFEQWVTRSCQKTYNVNVAILPDPRTQFRYIAELDQQDNLDDPTTGE